MARTESAVLGGGCFWCLEAAYQEIKGVIMVEPGYAGGSTTDPTYETVCSGTTGHAEVVRISFDPEIISYSEILDIFWAIHDPTTLNRQGNDVGPQYRSLILYQSDKQQQLAKASIARVSKLWPDKVVTKLEVLKAFYPAENYHKDYYQRNPSQPYCQIIINPKLAHLRQNFRSRLKNMA